MLYWQGRELDRHGEEYQTLLLRAFRELAKNERFKKALLNTGSEEIRHSEGKRDPSKTILTENEFCNLLMKIRGEYKH